MAKKRPEHQLQNIVRDLLLRDGYLVVWMNSGAQKIGERFVIFNRWRVSGESDKLGGASDLIAVGHGWTLFIELKADGGRLSENQKAFGDAVVKRGGEYVVVRSVEDLRPFLKNVEI